MYKKRKKNVFLLLQYFNSFFIIIGFLHLLDFLKITYYPTINRNTVVKIFLLDVKYDLFFLFLFLGCLLLYFFNYGVEKLFSLSFIPYLFIDMMDSSILFFFSFLIYFLIYIYKNNKIFIYIYYFFVILFVLELIMSFIMLNNPLFKNIFLYEIISLDMKMYYIFSVFTPLIALMFLFMWISKVMDLKLIFQMNVNNKINKALENPSMYKYIFIMSIILSIIFSIYPYLEFINPDNKIVGVDFTLYYSISKTIEKNPSLAFKLLNGERSLFLLLIYFLQKILSIDLMILIKYMPLILNPLYVISMYLLGTIIFNDKRLASYAAFFSACSYHITINMYSYFLANMLALSIMNVSIFLLFDSYHTNNKLKSIVSAILSSSVIYIHPWTFNMYFSAIIIVFTLMIIKYIKNKQYDNKIKIMIYYILIVIIFDIIKVYFFKGMGIIASSLTQVSRISLINNFWSDSIFTFRYLYGGMLSNFMLFLFSLFGVLALRLNYLQNIFIFIYLIISSFLYVGGNATFKSRILFSLPIEFFFVYGYDYLFNKFQYKKYKFAQYYVFFNMLNYTLQSLHNLI